MTKSAIAAGSDVSCVCDGRHSCGDEGCPIRCARWSLKREADGLPRCLGHHGAFFSEARSIVFFMGARFQPLRATTDAAAQFLRGVVLQIIKNKYGYWD